MTTFLAPFDYPFYSGVGTASDVPDFWDVAINGHGFMVDIANDAFKQGISTIPLLRSQVDTSSQIGQGSVNPDDLWPRTQQSWHHGAGQEFLDRTDSDNLRFYTSFGIDPWTQGQVRPLNSVRARGTSVNTNLAVLQAGTYTYLADGTTLSWSTDVATAGSASWTSAAIQAGESAVAINSIATDGNTIFAALGANGIHITTRGATTSTHYNALNASILGYVKGRLMAIAGNNIYNVTASGAAPTALYTHPNSDFAWVGFAEGQSVLFAAGFSGDKSLIYKTAVVADGTALAIPTVAGELPDGEIVRAIQGYLGFLIVGTDRGFRVGTQDASGNLTFGALVQTPYPVKCFEPQDRFVWFGWSNYDGTYSGLGRIDLSVFTAPNVPAYASDIMATTQGTVTSVCTVSGSNLRAFTVSGVGLFSEYATPVTSCWLQSGKLDYGIGDNKIALRLKLRHQPLTAGQSVHADLSADGEAFTYVGVNDVVGSNGPDESFRIGNTPGRTFNVKLSLFGDVKVERYDLQAYPATVRRETIVVPLLLINRIQVDNHAELTIDPRAEYDFIRSFVGANAPVKYQELGSTYTVFIEEVNFQRNARADTSPWWNGTAVLKMKALGD